jgi:hypothetical protein
MLKGRPFQPGNQLGRGRPVGSRNKKSLLAQDLLDRHAGLILRQAVKLARKGDSQMVRFRAGYILPRRNGCPVNTGPLPTGGVAELSQSSVKLMNKVTSGQLTPNEGLEIADPMDHRRRIIETENHEVRFRALEKITDQNKAA